MDPLGVSAAQPRQRTRRKECGSISGGPTELPGTWRGKACLRMRREPRPGGGAGVHKARKAGEACKAWTSRALRCCERCWCLTAGQGTPPPPKVFKQAAKVIRSVIANLNCLGPQKHLIPRLYDNLLNLSQNHRLIGAEGAGILLALQGLSLSTPQQNQSLPLGLPLPLRPHCRSGRCTHGVPLSGLKAPRRGKLNLNSLWTWSSDELSVTYMR